MALPEKIVVEFKTIIWVKYFSFFRRDDEIINFLMANRKGERIDQMCDFLIISPVHRNKTKDVE